MPPGREGAVIIKVKIDGRAKTKRTVVYRKWVNGKGMYLRTGGYSNYACGIMASALRSKNEKGYVDISSSRLGFTSTKKNHRSNSGGNIVLLTLSNGAMLL